jgi:membrane protein DedA with SNARE-associated domain
MSPSIIHFIAQYSYLAVFLIIIAQELGVPIPFPNELVLMFCGYLAFSGKLNLFLVIITAFAASIAGAWILYGIFYWFGVWIHPKLPAVLQNVIKKASEKIDRHPVWIFIGRIIPFGRGYICIAAGLAKVKPVQFAYITISADTIWNAGFIILGFATGKYWEVVANQVGGIVHLILYIILAVILYSLLKFGFGKYKTRNETVKGPVDSDIHKS